MPQLARAQASLPRPGALQHGGALYCACERQRARGLTLSGTKTHVKQRFLPLTPLLMVSDVLWSPVLPA
ncbi:hypothetical protein EBH56_22585 [Salmonella enterica]|nr:hypothetical protein [Salmonella enterica]